MAETNLGGRKDNEDDVEAVEEDVTEVEATSMVKQSYIQLLSHLKGHGGVRFPPISELRFDMRIMTTNSINARSSRA